MVKNLPADAGDAETQVRSGSGRSLGEGNGNPLQYSCLENLIDRRSSVHFTGFWRVRHDWRTEHTTHEKLLLSLEPACCFNSSPWPTAFVAPSLSLLLALHKLSLFWNAVSGHPFPTGNLAAMTVKRFISISLVEVSSSGCRFILNWFFFNSTEIRSHFPNFNSQGN